MRIPFMLFSLERAEKFGLRTRQIGSIIGPISRSLGRDLKLAALPIGDMEYRAAVVISAIFWFLFLFLALFLLLWSVGQGNMQGILSALSGAAAIGVVMLIVLLRYPRILAGKRREIINKELLYVLRDLLMAVSSGLPIFSAISMAAQEEGVVSQTFSKIKERVEAGGSLEEELERAALLTPSPHFQNVLWQLSNTARSGADVRNSIRSIIRSMEAEERSNIQRYAQELNVLTLLYMLAAVAIPTILITVMMILTTFSSVAIGESLFILLISSSFFVEIGLIGFIKSRRPLT